MSRFTTSDGLSLAYDDAGAGLPVLCLAGLTRSMNDFLTVRDGFADRARIIRLDSRGRGKSDHDPNWANYNIPVEARDALELCDHLGLDTVTILGSSRGGLLAMTLAATAKPRLAGVLLNDIGPVLDDSGITAIMGYVGLKPPFRTYDEAADGLRGLFAEQFSGLDQDFFRRYAEITYEQKDGGLDLRYDPKLRDALQAQAEAELPPDIWPLFDALDGVPLACLRGINSNILSAETARDMRERRPDMIYAEVPGRGHLPFLDEPESRAVIAALLDKVAQ